MSKAVELYLCTPSVGGWFFSTAPQTEPHSFADVRKLLGVSEGESVRVRIEVVPDPAQPKEAWGIWDTLGRRWAFGQCSGLNLAIYIDKDAAQTMCNIFNEPGGTQYVVAQFRPGA